MHDTSQNTREHRSHTTCAYWNINMRHVMHTTTTQNNRNAGHAWTRVEHRTTGMQGTPELVLPWCMKLKTSTKIFHGDVDFRSHGKIATSMRKYKMQSISPRLCSKKSHRELRQRLATKRNRSGPNSPHAHSTKIETVKFESSTMQLF